ncbi:phosphotransferase [Streptomyces solicathayae]|uniref:Phosphotransferase n=1 Tax=Streptomyces solicathayae TaxID=3081768 RepID=A0ABZ0M463_9ACTN|nr:phosphotransferase [Streptomyces sp. HUAS YS2]WOX26372.1 phosphotransferase [Streptomyces sp. HUAS YS2]
MRQEIAESVDRGDYPDGSTPWDRPAWQDEALGWVGDRLADLGLEERGPRAVRLRPWSVLVRLTVGEGAIVWFKANPAASAFEAGLGQALATWVPAHVLAPLAVDAGRGWSLLPDGGPILRDVLDRGPADPGAWEEPLRQYALMQRALTGRTEELRGMGVPDGRAAVLPEVFDEIVATSHGLESAERRALIGQRPRLVEWCEELASTGIADSLDHSDLHEDQVFARGGGRYAFFDWGDAAVAHPFTSLLVTARMARVRYGPDVLPRLRDAYLEPWTGDGRTKAELRRAVALACRLGAIGRACSWGRIFPGPDGDGSAASKETSEATARWLRELFAEEGLWPA